MIGEIQKDLQKELQEKEDRDIFKQEMSLDRRKTINYTKTNSNCDKKLSNKDSLEVFVKTMESMKVVITQNGSECQGCVYYHDEVTNVAKLLIDDIPLYSIGDLLASGLAPSDNFDDHNDLQQKRNKKKIVDPQFQSF